MVISGKKVGRKSNSILISGRGVVNGSGVKRSVNQFPEYQSKIKLELEDIDISFKREQGTKLMWYFNNSNKVH